MKKVKVRIPATIGNLGPGFDVLGMAVSLYTNIEMSVDRFSRRDGTKLDIREKDRNVPRDKNNMIWKAAHEVFKECGKFPVKCTIRADNRIPLSRGLGSSAAARVGGLLCANALCKNKLSKDEILNIASRLEGHPDNVAPAMFGSVVISARYKDEVKYCKLKMGKKLKVVACIPDFEISTEKARKLFPKQISRSEGLKSQNYFALSAVAYMNMDFSILDEATKDYWHQPYRKKLVLGIEEVFEAAKRAGGYGAVLSGSGPTIVALCKNSRPICDKVGKAMVKIFKKHDATSRYAIYDISPEGAVIC